MKGLLKYVLFIGFFFAPAAYGYLYDSVEFYNEGGEGCCGSETFTGLYLGASVGYSWYNFFLHRPPDPLLEPLNKQEWTLHEWVPIVAVGYDFYPKKKIPARVEINFTYDDVKFTSDPLFIEPFGPGVFASDLFRLYNTMLAVYLDWHTCTRIVPYVGASGGYEILLTQHDPAVHSLPRSSRIFSRTQRSFSYGGTIGARFFFTNHVVANLQFRFNDLKGFVFRNEDSLIDKRDYLSDYLHETTMLFGLAYQF